MTKKFMSKKELESKPVATPIPAVGKKMMGKPMVNIPAKKKSK